CAYAGRPAPDPDPGGRCFAGLARDSFRRRPPLGTSPEDFRNRAAVFKATASELDQLVAEIGEEILSRIGNGKFSRAEGLNISDLVCPGCTGRCPQTCAKKTREIVA